MPEMPEVATAARYIDQDVHGKTIVEAKILVAKMVKEISVPVFEQTLQNKNIKLVTNIGKHLVFVLSNNLILLSHLRMEGRYRFAETLHLGKHDHAWFRFDDGFLVFQDTRKFATFHLRKQEDFLVTPPLNKLGFLPEDIDANYLYHKLKHKQNHIKTALLDQSLIIGLGNIYVDEVLWASKIHPQKRGYQLSLAQMEIILTNIVQILNKATLEGGSSIKTYLAYNKIKGNYQKYLKVHTKKGEVCPRCHDIIKKIKVNGRGTYYCPSCQRL